MEKQEQEQYPSLWKVLQLSAKCDAMGLRDDFPNTIWNHGGIEVMASCIGFLRGMLAAGHGIGKVDKMAKTLLRSFHVGMRDDRYTDDKLLTKWDQPHLSKLIVTGTSTFMSFGFSQVIFADDQAMAKAHPKHYSLIGNAYQDSSAEKKWIYLPSMYGGIDFHGLDRTFSVSLTPTIGWQRHT